MKPKKLVFGAICILLICSAYTVLPKNKYKVCGTVMRVKAYCGGARMPEERLNEWRKPYAYKNKKLFVKTGKYNDLKKKPVLEFVSDSTGNFSFSLSPGFYCIVDEFKKNKANYNKLLSEYKTETRHHTAISASCLKEWFKTPDAVFEVKAAGNDSLTITFHDKCPWNTVPCVTYQGPVAN